MADRDEGNKEQTTSLEVTVAVVPRRPEQAFYLVVFDLDTSWRYTLPADGEAVIGRAESCGLRLRDSSVSRQHARIGMSGGVARLMDLGSHNGVTVNGVRLTDEQPLRSRDIITLGKVTLIYHSSAALSPGEAILPLADWRVRADQELDRASRSKKPL